MSNKNPGKFFYYPAPPPHIINYFLIFVKHFIALFFGQIFWPTNFELVKRQASSVKRQASSVKRQASDRLNAYRTLPNGNWTEKEAGVRQAECLANAGQRKSDEGRCELQRSCSSHGEKVQALPRPPSQTVYHRF